MTDQQALVAAIVADPDEDTPRLAYADWLDEHAGTVDCRGCEGKGYYRPVAAARDEDCDLCVAGQVHNGYAMRAATIRLGIESARQRGGYVEASPEDDQRQNWLYKQEEELWAVDHYQRSPREVMIEETPLLSKWLMLPARYASTARRSLYNVAVITRGFVSEVIVPWLEWEKDHAALEAALPLKQVELNTMPVIPVGVWDHCEPHRTRGPRFKIAGEMVESPSHDEWCLPDHQPGRTREWFCEMLRRRWPKFTFMCPIPPAPVVIDRPAAALVVQAAMDVLGMIRERRRQSQPGMTTTLP